MTDWASYLQMITSPLHTDLYWTIFLHQASVWAPASNKHPPYICSPNHLVLTLHLANTCIWPNLFIHRTSVWSPASNKYLPMYSAGSYTCFPPYSCPSNHLVLAPQLDIWLPPASDQTSLEPASGWFLDWFFCLLTCTLYLLKLHEKAKYKFWYFAYYAFSSNNFTFSTFVAVPFF